MPERPDVEGYSAMPEGRSGADYAPSGDAPHLRTRTTFKPKIKIEPKGEGLNRFFNKYIPGRLRTNIKKRGSYIDKDPRVYDALLKQGLIEETGGVGAWDYVGEGGLESEAARQALGKLGYNPNPPAPDRGGGGQDPWLYPPTGITSIDTPETTTTSTALTGGDYLVPENLLVGGVRAAEGGRIGYQMGNMVGAEMEGAEMEGAEMEGAMMQSQEVIKELYDALIAQGLSPQEAMEKIKEIIASTQTQEPQSPMMGEEFPGQEFSGGPRVPAAFGGIMDTYTGRRKYGLGSFISKALKKVKKLASSKLGKLALMYAAGTYLGGTQAFGGTGYGVKGVNPWKKFGKQLLTPMGDEGIANVGRSAMNLFSGKAPAATKYGADAGYLASGAAGGARLPGAASNITPALAKSDWSKWILPASIGAGAYTAYAPVEGLDDTTDEWEEDKAKWDAYYAGLGGDYRVPENLRLAQGGRIGYRYGKTYKDKTDREKFGTALRERDIIGLEPYFDLPHKELLALLKGVRPSRKQGRSRKQEGGLMDLGGMEKDYRNDGGFVPLGGEEKADDVPARLSRNEFVFTADAVKNAGGGDIDRGAEVMENVMKNLEGGGKISEESQGQGAQEMFEVSERLSEVI